MTVRAVVQQIVRFVFLLVVFVAFWALVGWFGAWVALGLWALLGVMVLRS